jgi:integrase
MKTGKLTALKVNREQKPGYLNDGGGLYLRVTDSGSKSWAFRYRDRVSGKLREMGLGSTATLTLKEGREAAQAARKLISEGLDPIDHRNASRQATHDARAKAKTFRQCAEEYIADPPKVWRSAKHAAQWTASFETYVYPFFGDKQVGAIDIRLVREALLPIWRTKPVTASRVRERIARVLDWAAALEYHTNSTNPARVVKATLPPLAELHEVTKHPAMPIEDVAKFIARLRALPQSSTTRGLEFLILVAARTKEVLGATWPEIDLEARQWVIPPSRMKAGKEHVVPLSGRALAILEEMRGLEGAYVFPGRFAGSPLSESALLKVLRRLGHTDLHVHGFRAAFSTWAATAGYSSHLVEFALAHAVATPVARAYNRTTLPEMRLALMEDWARYCGAPPGANVVPMRRAAQ